jgi:selenocysteine lyase/cysteine desulfurase
MARSRAREKKSGPPYPRTVSHAKTALSRAGARSRQAVVDRLAHFNAHESSNIHRAAHALAARATDACEGARETVRRFGLETTVRPSLAFYDTGKEVDRMAAVVRRLASARR